MTTSTDTCTRPAPPQTGARATTPTPTVKPTPPLATVSGPPIRGRARDERVVLSYDCGAAEGLGGVSCGEGVFMRGIGRGWGCRVGARGCETGLEVLEDCSQIGGLFPVVYVVVVLLVLVAGIAVAWLFFDAPERGVVGVCGCG